MHARALLGALIAGFDQFNDVISVIGGDGSERFTVEGVDEKTIFFDVAPNFSCMVAKEKS